MTIEEIAPNTEELSLPNFTLQNSVKKNLQMLHDFVKHTTNSDDRQAVFKLYEAYRKTRYLAVHEAATKRSKARNFAGISLKMD